MKTNFSLLFYLKKQKNYAKGPAPVYMRITVAGKRAEVTASRECDPDKWNAHAGRANGTKEEARTLNAYLDNLQAKVYEAHHTLTEDGKLITAETLKNKFCGKNEKPRMLVEIFKKHNEDIAKLIKSGSKKTAPGTLERYETALRHLQDFLQKTYGVSDYDIRQIDLAFINDFDLYLRTERKCANNSTVKYVRNIGKIINISFENNWITINPLRAYKGKLEKVKRDFLSDEDIERIANKEFASERLTQVRDVFLFACYTGLAYADAKKLRTTHIIPGVDGEKWIIDKREKTDQEYNIPLLPPALEILEKYETSPMCVNKGIPLPVKSNQKLNDYLKEIAEVCHIRQKLTFHTARHTFATTITLLNGVSIESVSRMLGHTNIRTTQMYAKIIDQKVSREMAALKEKLYGIR